MIVFLILDKSTRDEFEHVIIDMAWDGFISIKTARAIATTVWIVLSPLWAILIIIEVISRFIKHR